MTPVLKIVRNWMRTLLVYLISKDVIVIRNLDLNQMMRQYAIIYGTPLIGEVYQARNAKSWMITHKLTIRGVTWAHTRIFQPDTEIQGA